MKKLRCAIYTRKSSEEGLEQSFNSLHAQREACEAYIRSQSGEGWTLRKTAYDDGGFSGGSLVRPALQRLLEDIRCGAVDVVVVYKVDRLTRSLTDFARIVEAMDAQGVSFVSVTQAFNTTSSMGRLTLNVLLSFAQFEREVTGERIRDKIAASKAKGMWMGGNVPLGYDARDRTLVINPQEAETVRMIFRRYLELGSVHALKIELDHEGVTSKPRTSASGRTTGGGAISRGALFHLLQNRLYQGKIMHKGKAHPGLHEAIIDEALFEQVQRRLGQNRRERGVARPGARAPLSGLLVDSYRLPMTPAAAHGRGGKVYRYYVAARLQQGGLAAHDDPDALLRVPALPLEELVLNRLRRLFGRASATWKELSSSLLQVQLLPYSIVMTMREPAGGVPEMRLQDGEKGVSTRDGQIRITMPVRMKMRGGRAWILKPDGSAAVEVPRPNASLINALKRAHEVVRAAGAGQFSDCRDAKGIDDPYLRKLARLAFLAPDIQKAILAGRQPPGLTLSDLTEPGPFGWAEQRRVLGFGRA